jgi:hypothetical protein
MKAKKIATILFVLIALVGILSPSTIHAAQPHRIAVREVNGNGEFYDTTTGATFVPRGTNYIRQEVLEDPWSCHKKPDNTWECDKFLTHSMFHVGSYDAQKAETALREIRRLQYNVVRVFVLPINAQDAGSNAVGLSEIFLRNVADFITRAKHYEIFVILTFNHVPKIGGYGFLNSTGQFQDENWYYLAPEGIDAKKRYLTDFINGIRKFEAPLEYIFNYDIENEPHFINTFPPLSLSSGNIKTAIGKTYDIGTSGGRQLMMDEGLNYWINEVRKTIREIDPTALVAPSFFSPAALTVSNPFGWVIRTYHVFEDPALGGSQADFIDLHTYPGWLDPNLSTDLKKTIVPFELSSHKKPIILGEFGTEKRNYSTIDQAVSALKKWQVESCTTYGVRGWIQWEWNDETETNFWHATDSNESIATALSPLVRADPCKLENTTSTSIPSHTLSPSPTVSTIKPTKIIRKEDLNADGRIDIFDYNILVSYIGKTGSPSFSPADIDKNGKVDIFDYNSLITNFGT